MSLSIFGPIAGAILREAAPHLGRAVFGDKGGQVAEVAADIISTQLGVSPSKEAFEEVASGSPEMFRETVTRVEEHNLGDILANYVTVVQTEQKAGELITRIARPLTAITCLTIIAGLFIASVFSPERGAKVVAVLADIPMPLWTIVGGLPLTYYGLRSVEKIKGAA